MGKERAISGQSFANFHETVALREPVTSRAVIALVASRQDCEIYQVSLLRRRFSSIEKLSLSRRKFLKTDVSLRIFFEWLIVVC